MSASSVPSNSAGLHQSSAILPAALPISCSTPSPVSSQNQQTMVLQQQAQYQAQHLIQHQKMQQQTECQQRQKDQQLLQQQRIQQTKVAQHQHQTPHGQLHQSQSQQPTQQHHIPHQGLNGGWQSDKDVHDRRMMISKIVHLLRQRKPSAPEEWLKKLPQMGKRLEESLYRSAPSFEAYKDISTLKQRLQQLAMNVGMKSKQMHHTQFQGQQGPVPKSQHQQQTQPAQSALTSLPLPEYQQQPQQTQHQHQTPQTQQTRQPQQQLQHSQRQHMHPYNNNNMQISQQHQQQNHTQQHTQQQQPQLIQHQQPGMHVHPYAQVKQPPQRQIVKMSDINPIMSGGSDISQQPVSSTQLNTPGGLSESGLPQATPTNLASQSSLVEGMIQSEVSNQTKLNGQQSTQQVSMQSSGVLASTNTISANSMAAIPSNLTAATVEINSSRPGSDRQQVLRHQQQRLLLLRHAAKCPHEDVRCPVTPHCAGMKRLWKHIAECKDQKCLVPHCVSSRYVLSHYHRCKDVRCPVCGPVREAIHRSHEKQKQMQVLKQRHEQALQQQNSESSTAVAPQKPSLIPQRPLSVAMPAVSVPLPVVRTNLTHTLTASQSPVMLTSNANTNYQTSPPTKKPKTDTMSLPGQIPSSLVPDAITSHAQPVQSIQQLHHEPAAATSGSSQYQHLLQTLPVPSFQSVVPIDPLQVSAKVENKFGSKHDTPFPATTSTPTSTNQIEAAPAVSYSNGQASLPVSTPTPGPKPQEDHTLINCFTIDQIETHISSLNRGLQLPPPKLKTICLEVLKVLQAHDHGWVFNTPVDPVELGLPDYFQIIKRPMDLGSIKKRLENGCYHALGDFEGDVYLTFDNAMLYNPEGSVVYNMAEEMKLKFAEDYAVLVRQLQADEDEKRKNGNACALCGNEKLLFEPPVFYCNGINCPSKRIRRNSYYFVGGNNQYHWCHQCYGELKDNQDIEIADITLKKQALSKKKNDEVHEESWVQCDRCERWIHQICGLFNTRQNKDQRSEYVCPRCTIDDRKKRGVSEGSSTTPMAEDLPRTKLSEYLENHVREKVDEYFNLAAKARAVSENILMDEAKKGMAMGGPITIRQVTSMDRKLEVRERMLRRYAFKKYPSEFTFRCKCIIVFQNLDGVDVILFGLYVYEHDEDNPAPNQRTVYVSYLDSVYYMRPRNMRTYIYHEILIAYLNYVRMKGFATAHIWACPPLKGDDYILYAKPEDQKTPRDDRLRQWYIDMLLECQKRGIVGKLTNMYDQYLADPKNDATVVPYMDGDYFPAEVENIIKDIEEGKNNKKTSAVGKKKNSSSLSKSKAKTGRGGTRSTGLDEQALAASGIIPPGYDQKSLEEGNRDYVMAKIGETIQPMKESFIVAYLSWVGAKAEDMIVPKEIAEYRENRFVQIKTFETTLYGGDEKLVANGQASSGILDKTSSSRGSQSVFNLADEKKVASFTAENSRVESHAMPIETFNGSGNSGTHATNVEPWSSIGQISSAEENAQFNYNPDSSAGSTPSITSIRDGKFAAMAARKRDIEGKDKAGSDLSAVLSADLANRSSTTKDKQGCLVKVLDDDLEEMDCEFLNNRQAFLNLCQGNHYQFDQLRRAKHSSMMVLWHLHNRDAPKFVQQCAVCSREILTGYRYHCPTCADYDQCHDCLSNPNTPRHPHQLKPFAVASSQQSELTDVQRKERQRSIQLHMTLLLHAATCVSPTCPSANCTKMKGLFKHGAQCQVKAAGGCYICKRIWALLQIHARQCKQSQCPVPNCIAIRERFRQLMKQQQAMDDRRRQEMNRAYRGARP